MVFEILSGWVDIPTLALSAVIAFGIGLGLKYHNTKYEKIFVENVEQITNAVFNTLSNIDGHKSTICKKLKEHNIDVELNSDDNDSDLKLDDVESGVMDEAIDRIKRLTRELERNELLLVQYITYEQYSAIIRYGYTTFELVLKSENKVDNFSHYVVYKNKFLIHAEAAKTIVKLFKKNKNKRARKFVKKWEKILPKVPDPRSFEPGDTIGMGGVSKDYLSHFLRWHRLDQ